jgi:hypothetical protein
VNVGKTLKCWRMSWFAFKNRDNPDIRWLQVWNEIEGLYDQDKEQKEGVE